MGPKVKKWLKYAAANIRRLRLEQELTQEQLGELASIEPRYLQDVERARTNMSFAVFIQIADALKVAPASLLMPAKMTPARSGRPPSRDSRPKRPAKS